MGEVSKWCSTVLRFAFVAWHWRLTGGLQVTEGYRRCDLEGKLLTFPSPVYCGGGDVFVWLVRCEDPWW